MSVDWPNALTPRAAAACSGAGRVGVLREDVAALVDQRLGRVAFLRRVVPGVDHDELEPRLRVDRLHAEHEGVDALDNFGNGNGADITGEAGLAQFAGDDALHIPGFIETNIVGGDVGGALVSGAVLIKHRRMFLRRVQRIVHVAERGGEDQLVAGIGKVVDDLFGIRTLGHVLDNVVLILSPKCSNCRLAGRCHAGRSNRNRQPGQGR